MIADNFISRFHCRKGVGPLFSILLFICRVAVDGLHSDADCFNVLQAFWPFVKSLLFVTENIITMTIIEYNKAHVLKATGFQLPVGFPKRIE
jgi:hypothetical protein